MMRFFLIGFLMLLGSLQANPLHCEFDISDLPDRSGHVPGIIKFFDDAHEDDIKVRFKTEDGHEEYGICVIAENKDTPDPQRLSLLRQNEDPLGVWVFRGLNTYERPLNFLLVFFKGSFKNYVDKIVHAHETLLDELIKESHASETEPSPDVKVNPLDPDIFLSSDEA